MPEWPSEAGGGGDHKHRASNPPTTSFPRKREPPFQCKRHPTHHATRGPPSPALRAEEGDLTEDAVLWRLPPHRGGGTGEAGGWGEPNPRIYVVIRTPRTA